ncbi:MAG TPA: UDP-2,3-diacylglucosamine diphosphatase LpxI, partial [Candidatus Omnitrophota bacterium]|nr:UDP-2,3-diacylglucosamine diphosphatase LpxI [Candidatus Omnitrophota bacterium]
GGKIAQNGAVVIKMSKPNQDTRFDVPVIGPRTIKAMIRSKAKCLGIEAGKTLIIDFEKCLRLANKADICIVGA